MNTVERISKFVGSTFSLWVILFAILGFFVPEAFVGGKGYISFLLGVIMFGMGLTLSSEDFREVFRRLSRCVDRRSRSLPDHAFARLCARDHVAASAGYCGWCHFGRLLSERDGVQCHDVLVKRRCGSRGFHRGCVHLDRPDRYPCTHLAFGWKMDGD